LRPSCPPFRSLRRVPSPLTFPIPSHSSPPEHSRYPPRSYGKIGRPPDSSLRILDKTLVRLPLPKPAFAGGPRIKLRLRQQKRSETLFFHTSGFLPTYRNFRPLAGAAPCPHSPTLSPSAGSNPNRSVRSRHSRSSRSPTSRVPLARRSAG